jgi:hypothetical protein
MKRALALFVLLALVPSAGAGSYFPPPGDYVPEWSPDGTTIAFFTTRGRPPGYAAVGPDGAGERRLHDGDRSVSALSPDWKHLAQLRADGLYVDGHIVARHAQPEFSWAPTSDRLAFTGTDGLYVVRADGSGLLRVAEGRVLPGGGGVHVGLPVWSPLGDKIAYQWYSSGDWDLHVAGAGGEGDVNLTPGDGRQNVRPLWSPDGRSIAFVTSDRGDVVLELAVLAGNRRVLPVKVGVTNGELAWFPDGARIAVGTDARVVELVVATGRKRKWLPAFASGIDWSPDGARIAFAGGGECRDRRGIYVARADGTEIRRITNDCRIVGTAGPDRLRGTDLADVLLGLDGNDRLEALDPRYMGDTLDGGAGNDLLIGDFQHDTLKGRGGADTLLGGPSGDLLVGGPGRDVIDGQGGRDVIEARDGARDVVRCGTNRGRTTPEKDIAFVDRIDRVARGCEVLRRAR